MTERLDIMIAVPSYSGYPKAEHSVSVETLMQLPTDPPIVWRHEVLSNCPCLPRVRNALIAKAFARGCTHILFIDQDIHFDPRDVLRMIGHGVGVVGAVPQKRSGRYNDPPRLAVHPNGLAIDMGSGLATPPEPKIPMALTLINMDVFRKIREAGLARQLIYGALRDDEQVHNASYFGYEPVPVQEGYEEYEIAKRLGIEEAYSEDGEDHYFARRAHQVGFPIYLDCEVELGHWEGNVLHDFSLKKLLAQHEVTLTNHKGERVGAPVEGRLSLMIPTRGRPDLAKRAIKSLLANASTDIEIVVGLDDDDETARELMDALDFDYEPRVRFCTDERAPTLGALWNRLYGLTSGNIIGMMTDDCVVSEPGWDMKVRRALALLNHENIGFVFPKDPYHAGNFGTQFFFTRETGEIIRRVQGYVFEPWYPFWFNDTALNELGDMALAKKAMDWSIEMPEGRGPTTALVNSDVKFWARLFDYTRDMRVAAAEAMIRRINGGDVPSEGEMAARAGWCAKQTAHLYEDKLWGRDEGEPSQRYLEARAAAEAFMAPEAEEAA